MEAGYQAGQARREGYAIATRRGPVEEESMGPSDDARYTTRECILVAAAVPKARPAPCAGRSDQVHGRRMAGTRRGTARGRHRRGGPIRGCSRVGVDHNPRTLVRGRARVELRG